MLTSRDCDAWCAPEYKWQMEPSSQGLQFEGTADLHIDTESDNTKTSSLIGSSPKLINTLQRQLPWHQATQVQSRYNIKSHFAQNAYRLKPGQAHSNAAGSMCMIKRIIHHIIPQFSLESPQLQSYLHTSAHSRTGTSNDTS